MVFRKQLKPVTAGPDVQPDEPVQTESWTHGSVIAARVWGGVLGAAILCGPLALAGFAYQGLTAAPTAAVTKSTPGFTAAQQDAGAYALAYVTAWLSATTTDSSGLAAFTNVSSFSFPQTPVKYRDSAVSTISDPSGGIVSVVVGAAIEPAANAAALWPRRYYTVTVDTTHDPKLTVIGLPSPTTGPTASTSTVTLNYPNSLATSTGVGQTVTSFLQAYLTGQGDITVVLSPGTALRPIRPTPYQKVEVSAILSDALIPANPMDGNTIHVLVQTQLTVDANDQQPASYLLRLRIRAGRWEVAGIDTYPALSQ